LCYGRGQTKGKGGKRLPARPTPILSRATIGLQALQPEFQPQEEAACDAQRAAAKAVWEHSQAFKEKVSQVELHIKRGLAAHVPSCAEAELAMDEDGLEEEEASCPEHCRACAFGMDGCDSLPIPCRRAHTQRCVQCATAHSLQPDCDVLCASTSAVVKTARTAVQAAATREAAQNTSFDEQDMEDMQEAGWRTMLDGGHDCTRHEDLASEGRADNAPTEENEIGEPSAETQEAEAVMEEGAAMEEEAVMEEMAKEEAMEEEVSTPIAETSADPQPTDHTAALDQLDELEVKVKELQVALQRALARFRAFHAHERRAAHEAKVLEMLLADLEEDGCIIVADWKVKRSRQSVS
jgi:hypothetical protein